MIVGPEGAGERLDRWLAAALPDHSRAFLARLVEEGRVTVGGAVVTKASHRLHEGDEVGVTIPPPEPSELLPEAIPLSVVYEDADLIVIDKPADMVVHPSAGHHSGTLVHALLAHCGPEGLSGIGGVARPGIVHRLDRGTSGLLMVAKHDAAHRALAAQLKSRELSRRYLAVVKGGPKEPEGTVATLIGRHPHQRKKMAVVQSGGREAVSHYKVVARLRGASVVEVALATGRTHQVRVHMLHLNCPVIGDPVYSRATGRSPIGRQALHAWKLKFVHPTTGEPIECAAPLPDDMASLIRTLGGDPAPWR